VPVASHGAEAGKTGEVTSLEFSFAVLVDRVDFLSGLGATEFFHVDDRSTLFVDDAALDPLGASALSIAQIGAAAAHLEALMRSRESAGASSAPAFVLLRAALESASWAIWLLEPDDRDERMRRALRRHWSDSRESDALSRALTGGTGGDDAHWARAHRRWFAGVPVEAAQAPAPASGVVAAAAAVVEDFTETAGAAAVITSSWNGFGSVAIARFEADGEMFAGSLSMVLDVAETALSLFHGRASAASARPDDAPTLAHLRGR